MTGRAVFLIAFVGLPSVAVRAADVVGPASLVAQPLPPGSNDMPDEQPSPQHAWIPGHWHWGQGSYVWVSGHWEIPPVPYAVWVAPEWQRQGGGYALREGYWQQNPPPTEPVQPKEISITQPPPPPRPEYIPERPSGDSVWVSGYWDWQNTQFNWLPGHWETPPRANLVWVPTHWEARADRYVLVAGYWRDPMQPVVATPVPQQIVVAQPAPQPVVVVSAPPPPRTEVMYGRPSLYHEWVPGYWLWHGGRYVWIQGHWERPPHGRHTWVAPQWERRSGNYVFIEGHWR